MKSRIASFSHPRLSRLSAAIAVGLLGASAAAWSSEDTPVEVSRRVLQAMEARDLDAAEALFASTSSVFETGTVEGDWAHYRAHHIGKELDAFHRFELKLGDPESVRSGDASMAMVAWPLEYHIELHDGRKIDSVGTITFVLIQEDQIYRVRHMHWSSKRKPE